MLPYSDFRNSSDIDIAIYGATLSDQAFAKLCWKIESLNIIFGIDIVHADKLANKELLANIKQDQKIIYTRE